MNQNTHSDSDYESEFYQTKAVAELADINVININDADKEGQFQPAEGRYKEDKEESRAVSKASCETKPAINFNAAVLASSDNASQFKSDHADMVAHASNSLTGGPEGSNTMAYSEAGQPGVFSQKSSGSQKTVGSVSQISTINPSRRPPAHGQGSTQATGSQRTTKGGEGAMDAKRSRFEPNHTNVSSKTSLAGNVNIQKFLMDNTTKPHGKAALRQKKSNSRERPGVAHHFQTVDPDDAPVKLQVDNLAKEAPATNRYSSKDAGGSSRPAQRDAQASMITKLLRGFKLTQYAMKMTDLGYGHDVVKLAMISHREREELMGTLKMLPGHRERFINLFKTMEQLNPRSQMQKALQVAQKEPGSGEGDEEAPATTATSGTKSRAQRSSSQQRADLWKQGREKGPEVGASEASATTKRRQGEAQRSTNGKAILTDVQASLHNQIIFDGEQTRAYIAQLSEKETRGAQAIRGTQASINPPQQQQQMRTREERKRSISKGRRNNSNSLLRQYNQLEPAAKTTMNEQFLANIKSGRNHESFHEALQKYVDRSQEREKARNALSQIFPAQKFMKSKAQKQQVTQSYLSNTNAARASNTQLSARSQKQGPGAANQAQRAATNLGMPRPPLGQTSASKTQRKKEVSKKPSLAKGNAGQLGLPPQSQHAGSRGLAGAGVGQPSSLSTTTRTGHTANSTTRSSSNFARLHQQRENDKFETPNKNAANPRASSGQRPTSLLKQAASQRNSQHSLIPVLTHWSDRKQPQSRRSRDGSNIGKGVGEGFFNRRNSSAKGPRPPVVSGADTGTKDTTNESSLVHMNSNSNTLAADASMSYHTQTQMDSATRRAAKNGGMSNSSMQMAAVAKDMSILPSLMSPQEIDTRQMSAVEVRPQDQQRNSDVLNLQHDQLQNKFSIGDQALCRTEDNRGVKKDHGSRFSRVSLASKNTGEAGFEKAGRRDRCTPECSTPTDVPGNLDQSQVTQPFSNNIQGTEADAKRTKQGEFKESRTPILERSAKLDDLEHQEEQIQENRSSYVQPMSPEPQPDINNEEALNDLSSPLLSKEHQREAVNYGYSFNSKRVAQAPTFFNLRIMCHCLGKAMKRHIDFSQGVHWFLDELHEAKALRQQNAEEEDMSDRDDLEQSAFSYHFKDDLKIPTDEKQLEKRKASKLQQQLQQSAQENGDVDAANEYASDDFEQAEDAGASTGSKAGGKNKPNPFTRTESLNEFQKIQAGLIKNSNASESVQMKQNNLEDADCEELEEREDNIDDLEIHLDVQEQQLIEQIRRDEILRQTLKKDKDRLANISKNKSYLQFQLHEKDKKIKELTKMVHMFETSGKGPHQDNQSSNQFQPSAQLSEVLAVSDEATGRNQFDLDDFEDDQKMSKAEFLMAQIDLDPIESQYSQEQKQISSHYTQLNQTHATAHHGVGGLSNRLNAPKPESDYADNFQKQQSGRTKAKDGQQEPQGQNINITMANASFNSVSQGVSLRSSNVNGSGSISASGVFKTPSGSVTNKAIQKPPIMSKSQQQFFDGAQADESPALSASTVLRQKQKAEQEKFDRLEQIAILKEQLRFFDVRLEFDAEIFNEDQEVPVPSEHDIAAYCKYVTVASKMENETPVIALVYIERLLRKTGVLINKYNWKRFLLICLCVASKVWDDDSLENIHFPKVMSDVSVTMINKLEQMFLDLFLNYDLVVKGSEYAKYYFVMRTLAEDLRDEAQLPPEKQQRSTRRKKKDDWAEFPLQAPISAQQMAQLQQNAAKAELYLKERYELEVIHAMSDKFKANEQKARLRKFDSTV